MDLWQFMAEKEVKRDFMPLVVDFFLDHFLSELGVTREEFYSYTIGLIKNTADQGFYYELKSIPLVKQFLKSAFSINTEREIYMIFKSEEGFDYAFIFLLRKIVVAVEVGRHSPSKVKEKFEEFKNSYFLNKICKEKGIKRVIWVYVLRNGKNELKINKIEEITLK